MNNAATEHHIECRQVGEELVTPGIRVVYEDLRLAENELAKLLEGGTAPAGERSYHFVAQD